MDQGKDVILVGHSAGGFLGSHALSEFTPAARKAAGKSGAVVKLAFVAGALFPPGHEHAAAPFMDVQVRNKPQAFQLSIPWARAPN